MVLEARRREFLYAPGHPHTLAKAYPLGRRLATSLPGAILSSHVERSWGFRATVLVGVYITAVFLGGTYKEGARYAF